MKLMEYVKIAKIGDVIESYNSDGSVFKKGKVIKIYLDKSGLKVENIDNKYENKWIDNWDNLQWGGEIKIINKNMNIYIKDDKDEIDNEKMQQADVAIEVVEEGDYKILKVIKNRFGGNRDIVLNDSDEKCGETNNEPKIALYAIAEKGEGRVMKVGTYDSIEDIGDIMLNMFDRDVVLNFEYEFEE